MAENEVPLAELLLRRKELQAKVAQLAPINNKDLYEIKAQRQKVTDELEDVVVQVPIVSVNEVTAAFDHYSQRLRIVDSLIQQANWNTLVEVNTQIDVFADHVPPETDAETRRRRQRL